MAKEKPKPAAAEAPIRTLWVDEEGNEAHPEVSQHLEITREQMKGLARYKRTVAHVPYYRVGLVEPSFVAGTPEGAYRLIICFDPQLAAQNARGTRRGLAAINKTAKVIARETWRRSGAWEAPGPVTVEVTLRRGREIDHLNVWGALKSVCDGLFKRAITPDDNSKWVTPGQVTQEPHSGWKGYEEIELLVKSLPREQSETKKEPRAQGTLQ